MPLLPRREDPHHRRGHRRGAADGDRAAAGLLAEFCKRRANRPHERPGVSCPMNRDGGPGRMAGILLMIAASAAGPGSETARRMIVVALQRRPRRRHRGPRSDPHRPLAASVRVRADPVRVGAAGRNGGMVARPQGGRRARRRAQAEAAAGPLKQAATDGVGSRSCRRRRASAREGQGGQAGQQHRAVATRGARWSARSRAEARAWPSPSCADQVMRTAPREAAAGADVAATPGDVRE